MDTGRQTRVSSDAQEPTNTIYGQLLELPSGPQATARIRLHEDRKANISCGVSSLHAPGRWGIKPPTFCRQRLSPASLGSWAAAFTACFEQLKQCVSWVQMVTDVVELGWNPIHSCLCPFRNVTKGIWQGDWWIPLSSTGSSTSFSLELKNVWREEKHKKF